MSDTLCPDQFCLLAPGLLPSKGLKLSLGCKGRVIIGREISSDDIAIHCFFQVMTSASTALAVCLHSTGHIPAVDFLLCVGVRYLRSSHSPESCKWPFRVFISPLGRPSSVEHSIYQSTACLFIHLSNLDLHNYPTTKPQQ